MTLSVRLCKDADKEHKKSRRQYAHMFHYKGVICVAETFETLPLVHRMAILLHEVGHELTGYHATENAANAAVTEASGIPIVYKDSNYGKRLEWISPSHITKAKRFLGI